MTPAISSRRQSNLISVLFVLVSGITILGQVGCSLQDRKLQVRGVWVIERMETQRKGPVAEELYEAYARPMIGTKIYVYRGGIAKIVCPQKADPSGADSCVGRYVIDPSNESVSFKFDERTSCFESMVIPECVFQSPTILVARRGGDTLVMKKTEEPVGERPAHKPKPWDGGVTEVPHTTSSDGAADLPGRQGELAPHPSRPFGHP